MNPTRVFVFIYFIFHLSQSAQSKLAGFVKDILDKMKNNTKNVDKDEKDLNIVPGLLMLPKEGRELR